jgi:exopolysaccharide production protein ExoZ
MLEFFIGGVLGFKFGRDLEKNSIGKSVAMVVLAISVMLLLSAVFPRLFYGSAAAAMVAAGLFAERLGFLPRIPAMRRLGDASYSI